MCVCLPKSILPLPHGRAAWGSGGIALPQVTAFVLRQSMPKPVSTWPPGHEKWFWESPMNTNLIDCGKPLSTSHLSIRNKKHGAPLIPAAILQLWRKPAWKLSWQRKEKQQGLQKSGGMSWSYLKLTHWFLHFLMVHCHQISFSNGPSATLSLTSCQSTKNVPYGKIKWISFFFFLLYALFKLMLNFRFILAL